MKKLIVLTLLAMSLTACSVFQPIHHWRQWGFSQSSSEVAKACTRARVLYTNLSQPAHRRVMLLADGRRCPSNI